MIIKSKCGRWLQTGPSQVLLQYEVEPRAFPKAARIKNPVLTEPLFLKNPVVIHLVLQKCSTSVHLSKHIWTNVWNIYSTRKEKQHRLCGSHLFPFFQLKYPYDSKEPYAPSLYYLHGFLAYFFTGSTARNWDLPNTICMIIAGQQLNDLKAIFKVYVLWFWLDLKTGVPNPWDTAHNWAVAYLSGWPEQMHSSTCTRGEPASTCVSAWWPASRVSQAAHWPTVHASWTACASKGWMHAC